MMPILAASVKVLGIVQGWPRQARSRTDQDSVIVGVSLTSQGRPQYVFLEAVSDLKDQTAKKVLERRVETNGVWLTDGAPVYVSAAQAHQAEHKVMLSTDPQAEVVFHWRAIQRVLVVNIVISNAKAYIDGTFHGRGRARRPLYFEEFTYRFNRRYLGIGIAGRLIVACVSQVTLNRMPLNVCLTSMTHNTGHHG